MAKKKNKMTTGDAVKILANEMKAVKENIHIIFQSFQQLDYMVKDYSALFEQYIEHTKDGKSFIKKMEKLIEEKVNEQKANEQTDGLDTDGDIKDERVGAEGVRTQ
tara:strand:+ start:172 stop:489 length:318 start_codon:yes stop_codon:yes gene_type:complete